MHDATSAALPPFISAVGAFTVAMLGVEPPTLLAAFCGASLGLMLSVTIGRWRAIAIFPFVVIVAAELGAWVAAAGFDGAHVARNGLAGLFGLFAHPLISAVVDNIQPLAKTGIDWLRAILKLGPNDGR